MGCSISWLVRYFYKTKKKKNRIVNGKFSVWIFNAVSFSLLKKKKFSYVFITWTMCLLLRLEGSQLHQMLLIWELQSFWTLPISWHSEGTQFFRKWICFHHQVKELHPLDRADLTHQTRSSFHNIIFFQNTRQLTKSGNSMILSVIQCQNILKLSYSSCPELCTQLQTFST